MNWEAIGAVDETVGALAVLITLIILVVQIRHSVRAMDESNRLERAAAMDCHSVTIGRWRGRLMEHEELTSRITLLESGKCSKHGLSWRLPNLPALWRPKSKNLNLARTWSIKLSAGETTETACKL